MRHALAQDKDRGYAASINGEDRKTNKLFRGFERLSNLWYKADTWAVIVTGVGVVVLLAALNLEGLIMRARYLKDAEKPKLLRDAEKSGPSKRLKDGFMGLDITTIIFGIVPIISISYIIWRRRTGSTQQANPQQLAIPISAQPPSPEPTIERSGTSPTEMRTDPNAPSPFARRQ